MSKLSMAKKRKSKVIKPKHDSMIYDPDVKSYLEAIYKRFDVVIRDKNANNFTFICKGYHIFKFLADIVFSN